MTFKIDSNKCQSCGACVGGCPMGAIIAAGGKYKIDQSICAGCGMCVRSCPVEAIVEE
ncbi:MAG: 4Fe-4S binding protein [Alphaproteobacteria bacterium]|nr:4Fe-4S binding protein [Alphaproteobacteria bacterium]